MTGPAKKKASRTDPTLSDRMRDLFQLLPRIVLFFVLVAASGVAAFVQTAKGSTLCRTTTRITAAAADEGTKKLPWEFGRFLKTASFFDGLTPKFLRQKRLTTGDVVKPGDFIFKKGGLNIIEWGPLDDVVMGGASKTNLKPGTFDGEWTGFVTTANNGGFAGIRTKLFTQPKDASACRGIKLRVKGDGQRYKLIVRDDDEWNGTAWACSFDTAPGGRVTEVKVPWSKLLPTRFSRTVPGLGEFNRKTVSALQLTLSKFEYNGGLNPKFKEGPFRLDVEEVSFF